MHHFRSPRLADDLASRVSGCARTLAGLALLGSLSFTPAARAESIRLGGTGASIGTMHRLAEAYHRIDPSFSIEVVANLGSSGGIRALASGAIQIATSSRALKPDEAAAGLRAIEYGRTAFVMASSKPGITSISTHEIADFYAGRRTRWPDGDLVRVVLRPSSDGDSALLASFSSEVADALAVARTREGMIVGMTDQETVDAIERAPGGLGTASVALLLTENRQAHALAVDGRQPTLANLANGGYPYAKTLYIVLRADASPAVHGFVDFVLSEPGRRLLTESGHLVP